MKVINDLKEKCDDLEDDLNASLQDNRMLRYAHMHTTQRNTRDKRLESESQGQQNAQGRTHAHIPSNTTHTTNDLKVSLKDNRMLRDTTHAHHAIKAIQWTQPTIHSVGTQENTGLIPSSPVRPGPTYTHMPTHAHMHTFTHDQLSCILRARLNTLTASDGSATHSDEAPPEKWMLLDFVMQV